MWYSYLRLIDDLRSSNREKLIKRKTLEESWNNSLYEKHQQIDQSNKTSILLHDQCEKYKRYVIILWAQY